MNKIIAFSVILCCVPATSMAETSLTVSPSLLHFDYTEFGSMDEILDRESGWLPGLKAKLSYTPGPGWLIDIHGAYYQGTVAYSGQTQSGVPHTTSTDTYQLRLGGQIEKNIFNHTHLYIGAQAHEWQRNIRDSNNVSGLDETYKWIEYSIGLRSDIFINQKDLLNIEAAYLLTRNGTLYADLSRAGIGYATLELGDDAGGRLNLSWKRTSENNSCYSLSVFFEAWDFGHSNTQLTQGGSPNRLITEPSSETRNIGLSFNIEYSF
jgi:hypothetical protein